MLIAEIEDKRVDALDVERGQPYRCPECKRPVVLRRGLKVTAHFGHKPNDACALAKGETRAHLDAKRLVYDGLVERGIKAELECVVKNLSGDRRADVMAWSPKGAMVAFELQHTPIDPRDISDRAYSYADAGIWQMWIPFIRPMVWRDGNRTANGWKLDRYPIRPFEHWIYEFNGGDMWMYSAEKEEFWLADLAPHMLWKEPSFYYSEGGEENFRGGYEYESKRFMELTLTGPYIFDELRIGHSAVKARHSDGNFWPECTVAHFEVATDEQA